VYRLIKPSSTSQLPLRMLYQPAGDGVFHRACEADGYRGLVAAILDDPEYEHAALADRLHSRIRIALDLVLLGQLDQLRLRVNDQDATDAINIHTDEKFIRSLERIGFLSLTTEH